MLQRLTRHFQDQKRAAAKRYWRQKDNPCSNGPVIFEGLREEERSQIRRVLEFGASWGGNLKYLLDRMPQLEVVGVDINQIVLDLNAEEPRYTGLIGDEHALGRFADREFDVAFTVSVLDHLPIPSMVENVIGELCRVAKRVMLLEPWIEGVHGDVSNKTRNQVKRGLELGHKQFADYCYVWNYDAMLQRKGIRFAKHPRRLHRKSLGPFYYLYVLEPTRSLSAREQTV